MTLFLFIFGTVFGVYRDYYLLKIGFALNRRIKKDSFRHILHIPLFHKERLAKGDYVYRQNVVTDSLSELVLNTTSLIIQSILVIIGVLIIMLLINAPLTVISIILLPLLFVSIKIIGPKMGVWARKYTENQSELSSKINEAINNAETVQAFTLEDKVLNKVNSMWHKSYVYTKNNMLWGELLDGTNGLLVTIATSLVMVLGGSAALRGEASLGDLLIFMTYMGYLIGPVEQLISQVTTRNQKLIDVSRIYEVMTDHENIEFSQSHNTLPESIDGTIEFNGISYGYDDRTVLNNVSFTIPAGQKIGIIGPSGGGKSTILKLLTKFIEPHAGHITIDGNDVAKFSTKSVRRKIGWVSQSPQLFNENIFENLLEGDVFRNISNDEVNHAVSVSNIAEFVVNMPLAFKTPVGEDGGSLSGGQRQRIAIARALIKNAPILCLDEPTAALDVKSENYIRDSLEQIIKDKTVVMVTHRKPLLALMDVIYVMDNGTLTDVRTLGGLDSYLAALEGFEQKTAREEIYTEQQQMTEADIEQTVNADYNELVEERQAELEAVHIAEHNMYSIDEQATVGSSTHQIPVHEDPTLLNVQHTKNSSTEPSNTKYYGVPAVQPANETLLEVPHEQITPDQNNQAHQKARYQDQKPESIAIEAAQNTQNLIKEQMTHAQYKVKLAAKQQTTYDTSTAANARPIHSQIQSPTTPQDVTETIEQPPTTTLPGQTVQPNHAQSDATELEIKH